MVPVRVFERALKETEHDGVVRGLREEVGELRPARHHEAQVVWHLQKEVWGRAAGEAEDVRGLQGEAGELVSLTLELRRHTACNNWALRSVAPEILCRSDGCLGVTWHLYLRYRHHEFTRAAAFVSC